MSTLYLGSPAGQPADGLLAVTTDDGGVGLYHGTFDISTNRWVPQLTTPADSAFISTVVPVSLAPPTPTVPNTGPTPPGTLSPTLPVPPDFFPPSPRVDLDRAYNALMDQLAQKAEQIESLTADVNSARSDVLVADAALTAAIQNGNAQAIIAAVNAYNAAYARFTAAVNALNVAVLQHNDLVNELNQLLAKYDRDGYTRPPVGPPATMPLVTVEGVLQTPLD